MTRSFRLAALFGVLVPSGVVAQEAPRDTLGAVEVTAAAPYVLRSDTAPLALSARTRPAAERATEPALGLDAALAGLPGVWVSNRESRAQGERLLVRGLGWRAAFGVRGTHVILDGVPLTLADGQTQLNVVDPALVARAEVVRGPASTFWGSGAGGVVALSTDAPDGPRVQARALGGGYGTAAGSVSARPDLGPGRRLTAWGSYLDEDGYRDHGAARMARAGVSAASAWGGGEVSVVGLLAHVPRAESPGGITFDEAAADPRQTRDVTVARDASKALTQGHLGVSVVRPVGGVRLRAVAHGGLRTLDNPIVPRYIELDRRTGGLRLTAEGGGRLRWAAGAEGELQRDDRLESENVDGAPGAVQTDQVETVTSGALFARVEVPLAPRLTASAAARGDLLRYRADPASAPADARTLGAVSPSLGLAYRLPTSPRLAATVYANAAGALDAPTTTELGNRPDGAPGFDPSLDPERTWGAEAGARLTIAAASGTVGLDVAVFTATVRDLLVPFEVDDVTFYRNEGRTRHAGVELAVQPSGLGAGGGTLDGGLAYAWTRARFTASAGDLTVDGNRVPGVPEHLATASLSWTARALPLTVGVSGEAASGYAADSANEAQTDAYAVVHARLATALRLGPATARPFVSVRNAFDTAYTGSVVVNAFGGRYAEPAAGRHVLVGLALSF